MIAGVNSKKASEAVRKTENRSVASIATPCVGDRAIVEKCGTLVLINQ